MLSAAIPSCANAPAGLPEGVSVSFVQLRGDISVDRGQLHVENTTTSPVTIASAELLTTALPAPAATERDRLLVVEPGRAVNLPVSLAGITCSDAAPDPRVRASIDTGSGPERVEAPIADEFDVLTRLSRTACDRAAVEAVVHVEAVAVTSRPDGTGELELVITPVGSGDDAVRLSALRGTPLLRFVGGQEWPLDVTVEAGERPSRLIVAIEPQRCDTHAIAEDKVGTRFDVVADVDGREVVYPLPRSEEVAGALLSFTASACGL